MVLGIVLVLDGPLMKSARDARKHLNRGAEERSLLLRITEKLYKLAIRMMPQADS